MDNDLMARRLRPPSEPVHEAPLSTEQEAATFQPAEQLPPEWPAVDRPAVDRVVADEAAMALTPTMELPEVPWEFAATEGTHAGWSEPAEAAWAADEKATEASRASDGRAIETAADQAPWAETATDEAPPWAETTHDDASWAETASDQASPWAETASDQAPSADTATDQVSPWAETATDQAPSADTATDQVSPWAETATDEAPWADTATDEAPWAETATDEAPWAETATDQAPWAETATDQAPWAETANDGAPWTETAPDEVPWVQPFDLEAPWDGPSDTSPQGDAFAPDRPVWDQATEEPRPQAVVAVPDQPAVAADLDDAFAPVLPDVVEPVATLWSSLNGYHGGQGDVEGWPEVEETAEQPITEAPAQTQVAPQETSQDDEAVAMADIDSTPMETGDEAAPTYDPTAAFQLFGDESSGPADAAMAEMSEHEMTADAYTGEPGTQIEALQPADTMLGPTPPDDLFSVADLFEPYGELTSDTPADEQPISASAELEPVEPEPQEHENPVGAAAPAQMLVPMVTTASAMPSPTNPANLIVRIELTFVEDPARVTQPNPYPVAQYQPAPEQAAPGVPEPKDGSTQVDGRVEANAWAEPVVSNDPDDPWLSQPTDEAAPQTIAPPDDMSESSAGSSRGDPLSRVPAALIERRPRPTGTPVLAAAMSVGPAAAPAMKAPGLWFLSPRAAPAGAGAGGEHGVATTQSSPLLTAVLTIGMGALVVVLGLVFVLLMTSILH